MTFVSVFPGEEELNEQLCVINKTESSSDFNLSLADIPEEVRWRANKSGLDCMFNIYVEREKSVSENPISATRGTRFYSRLVRVQSIPLL